MPSCSDSALNAWLAPLRWLRVQTVFRNRRNTHARQHPHFVFHAILKGAAGRAGMKDRIDLFYRPTGQSFPSRVTKDHRYAVDLVFPVASEADVSSFSESLRQQVAEDANFELVELSPPQERSTSLLLEESLDRLDLASDEVCLDFLSPLEFTPAVPERPWLLGPMDVLRLGAVHLARIYPDLPWPAPLPSHPLHCLPYYLAPFRAGHESKSQPGRQVQQGFTGPLYLRGDWQSLLPLLLIGSELHTAYGKGDETAMLAQRRNRHCFVSGLGGYELRTGRTCVDRLIVDPARYKTACIELSEESAVMDELRETLDPVHTLAEGVCGEVRAGAFQAAPIRLHHIPKPGGEARVIGLIQARDRILLDVLRSVLTPPFDRMLESGSVGFRPGRSLTTARALIREAVRNGANYAVRADVESFFDSIPWPRLESCLDGALPRNDVLTRAALKACWTAPALDHGRVLPRERGVPQGSPLSPLLANVYLDGFDEAMASAGHPTIRYGDDFLILARSLEEAEAALATARSVLAYLGLTLHPDKTAVVPLDLGFRFLGMELPGRLDEEQVEQSALRKSLLIRESRCFTGVDGRSVVVRKDQELIARYPMERIGEVVFYGDGVVSHRLMQVCARERIPVSFCTPAGWHACTVRPDSRTWYGRVARHHQRFVELGQAGRVRVARRIVEAKLRNYLGWLRRAPGDTAQDCRTQLESVLHDLPGCDQVEALRGHEGWAARRVFAWINSRIPPEFHSERRLPREKPDRWNVLLDFLYSRLFTRLNVLVMNNGLDPYLGFLHSGEDNYEAMVCDLQEPFRARVDQLAIKLVNRKEVQPADFEEAEGGQLRIAGPAFGRLLEAFAREEDVRLAREPSTFGQLMVAQVHAMRDWVEGKVPEPTMYACKDGRPGAER